MGWIQCYEVGAWPEEAAGWWALGLERPSGGIDYLLGDPSRRGQGLGPAVIRAFVREVCFGRHPEWRQVCADPLVANVASWRALGKAGFRSLGDLPSDHGPERLMVCDRVPVVPPTGHDGRPVLPGSA